MADQETNGGSLLASDSFLLRRLHSLSGIVPVGFFLIEHLLTNSRAFGAHGRESFNDAVKFLHHLPFLTVLEVVGIFIPLAFHVLFGLVIAFSGKPNVGNYPYQQNVRYTLQRVSGYIAFLFIVLHLGKFRFAHWFGGTDFMQATDYFEVTRAGLMEWALPPWATLTIYVIGLTAAVYHFANGLWTFSITWGIVIGPEAQRKLAYACAGVGCVMLLWGYLSLYAFATAEPSSAGEKESNHPPAADVRPENPTVRLEPISPAHRSSTEARIYPTDIRMEHHG